jgi:multiple sugar transport system permease protein
MKKRSIFNTVISWLLLGVLIIIYLFPLFWLILTTLKSRPQIFNIPPLFTFKPIFTNFRDIFYVSRTGGDTHFAFYFQMSILISVLSTLCAVTFGTMAAYSLSRFKVSGKNDLMFLILSTRMLPAVATLVPLYLMYIQLGLRDTIFGMVLLYTMFNLGFTVWMMKSFIDEIPKEYEEAALVDGYTRFEAFMKIVLPQAATGIATSAVFSLIFTWNEFTYSSILTDRYARTVPPAASIYMGFEGFEWGRIAATALLFVVPVLIFTFIVRKSLLRGLTFGAIKR